MSVCYWENSKWISSEGFGWGVQIPDNYFSPIFRKDFTVDQLPETAELMICCVGFGMVYVNGEAVTDAYFTTPLTAYDHRVVFHRYDITRFLHVGKNTIGVMLGNGNYNDVHKAHMFRVSWRAIPRFTAKLLYVHHGEIKELCTDSSWKWNRGPIRYNHARLGETYDAREEQTGWKLPDFDDAKWHAAEVAAPPGGYLEENMIHTPVRVMNEHEAAPMQDGVYDCGAMCTGWVEIGLQAHTGDAFTIRYSEVLSEDGKLDTKEINKYNEDPHPRHQDHYIAREGKQSYHPVFVYHSFRYVEITGPVAPEYVKVQEVYADLPATGGFQCSDERLNTIHKMSIRTIRNNTMDVPTDNPGRSQTPWTGDNCVVAEAALLNFGIDSIYESWLMEFPNLQRPSGQLPGTMPSTYGFNLGPGPLWDWALFTIPYKLWTMRHNHALAKTLYENMKRYIRYGVQISDHDLLKWGLPDWNTYKAQTDTGVTSTAFFHGCVLMMIKISKALGYTEDAAEFEGVSEKIRQAYRAKYMKDGSVLEDTQCAIACTVYFDLCDENEKPALAGRLADKLIENGKHFDCGYHGVMMIPDVLSEFGHAELVYEILKNDEYPGYGYWIRQGMTTIPEEWDIKINSLDQQAFAVIDTWFFRHVAGIQYDWDGITLAPCPLKNVTDVSAFTQDVQVEIKRKTYAVHTQKKATLRYQGIDKVLEPGSYTFQL